MNRLRNGFLRAVRHAAVVFQTHLRLKLGEMLDFPVAGIGAQHADALGHRPVQLFRQRLQIDRAVLHIKIKDFTAAGRADRKRQRDGHIRAGAEALRVPDHDIGALERALEHAHQVQM